MSIKTLLEQDELIQAPGAYDALTAKIIQAQGFPAVYMTGYGVSVSMLGLPDLGFLTMTEMVENAGRMADAVSIPLIADADTGYGNPMNVFRAVREYEKAGVAAIQIEDQVWPKRCGHMAGKNVIEAEDMAAKIRAAVDARSSPDFVIIARTDALAVHGLDEAVRRAELYRAAGADVLFVEAPRTREEMAEIPRRLPGFPLLINMAPLTPNLPAGELRDMGYRLAIYPGLCLAAAISAVTEEAQRLGNTGRQRDFSDWIQSFGALNDWLEAPKYTAMEQKYKSEK
ncbi:MAG: isocitrate lyase/PEP mutase family protein [Pseudomonadota bacterium]